MRASIPAIATAWEQAKDRYNAFSSFFARFRLTGWKRSATSWSPKRSPSAPAASPCSTSLAIPALNDFDESKITTGRYAVKFVDRNGTEIGQRGILHNDAVELEDIPDHLIKATLATEDRRFFEHFGVDVFGTARALFENARANDVVQGGSTITQQLAKNLFLSFERSLTRKIKEAFLALLLEARFTKFEILKMYLDRAYLGGGAFGVEAASQFYFGKSVRDINLAEAALLAGLFKAPTRFAPHVNLPASRARTNEVLTNLVEAGYMSAGQVHAARLNPARVIEPRQSQSPDWFLDWAFEEVQRIAEGKRPLRAHRPRHGRSRHAARRAGGHGDDVALDADAARRTRSPAPWCPWTPTERCAPSSAASTTARASSTGPRTHAASRAPPSSSTSTPPRWRTATTPKSIVRDASGSCGNWSPRNYNGSGGSGRSLTVTDAFKVSLNTTAADLSFKVGREKVLEMTQRLGVNGVETHVLDGARRHRHHAARAHRRLRRLRQRRQAGPALRGARALQLQGRTHLLARARRAAARRRSSARASWSR